MPITQKPDNAEQIAERAYNIYRGMKEPMTAPHWDDLSRQEKGLLEWVVRYARLSNSRLSNN